MKTYRISGATNGWIAQRDATFKGRCYIVLDSGLTLRDAQKKLLQYFNDDFEMCYSNWGLVVSHERKHHSSAWSAIDGTRGYEYDGRRYRIEEEEELL